MTAPTGRSWHPDPRWADPLIAFLALLALLAASLTLQGRRRADQRPAEQVSLQGRLLEVVLVGPSLLTGRPARPEAWIKAEGQLREPWDQALLRVLRAETGQTPTARTLEELPPEVAGTALGAAYAAAYADGPLPGAQARLDVRQRLGRGYTADLLEARLLTREGQAGAGAALRAAARSALLTRLVGLGALGLGVLAALAGGVVVGLHLWLTRQRPPVRPLPVWELSGRGAALVFLLWFLVFFAGANLAALLLQPWPGLRWAVVPLGFTLQASAGVALICRAEGLSLRALGRRVAPGPLPRNLGWGLAFLALAVTLVLAVSLVATQVLKPEQTPQRDLQDLVRGLRGWGPSLVLFLVVAGLAPLFEELLFRGFLLPVLARGGRTTLALVLSALLFGAIHLQPAGLPTLATLGFVLGLALRHTGSLWPPILVHACWNGTIFLVMRALA